MVSVQFSTVQPLYSLCSTDKNELIPIFLPGVLVLAIIRRKRAKIGDILEISTYKGLAYAQYVYKHQDFGYLVRVLPGLHAERLDDLAKVVEQHERFFTFVFLNQALRGEIVRIIGNYNVPEWAKTFPLFRDGVKDPATGQVAT
jgi:hypothetical protein